MNLPRASQAVIPRNKVENYLLHLEHPMGGGKAQFFLRFGFRRMKWQVLAEVLKRHAEDNPVASSVADADGVTYLVEGAIETPSGRKPRIRSVWLVETGELAPRFITAYPVPA